MSEHEMDKHRAGDPEAIKTPRMVSLPTVITGVITASVLSVGANSLFMWRDQASFAAKYEAERKAALESQAAEFRHMDRRQTEILTETRAVNLKMDSQNQQIAQLVSDVRDHERRIARLEPRR
jgi:uncharacterized protein (DUF3084 family)